MIGKTPLSVFLPLGENLPVEVFRLEHQALGVQDLGLEPGPGQLLRCHAVVVEKTTGGKGRGAQNTHPAHLAGAQQGRQEEVQPHSCPHRQQGAEKLPGGQAKEDGFLVVPNFFVDFDFYEQDLLVK